MLPKNSFHFPKDCFGTAIWPPWLTQKQQISPYLKLRRKKGEKWIYRLPALSRLLRASARSHRLHTSSKSSGIIPKSHVNQIMIINLYLCTSLKPKLLETRCLQLSLRSKSPQEDILTMTRDTLSVCINVMIIRSLPSKYLLTTPYFLNDSLFKYFLLCCKFYYHRTAKPCCQTS